MGNVYLSSYFIFPNWESTKIQFITHICKGASVKALLSEMGIIYVMYALEMKKRTSEVTRSKLTFPSCVTLHKLFNLSKLLIPHL